MLLPKVIASSVIRSAHQGQSHGGVYIVDLETEKWRQVIDWNNPSINWGGRGADRGLRGIALYGGEVYLAASDELFVYGPGWKIRRSFRNNYLKHCHEICIYEDRLFLTSTGFDSVLELDLLAQRFTRGLCFRELDVQPVTPHPKLALFDPASLRGPQPADTFHINNVFGSGDTLFVAALGWDVLWQINPRGKLEPYARIPKGSHNARPYGPGVLLNDTAANRVALLDLNGAMLKSFAIEEYPVQQLQMADLPSDHARQAFGRGLAVASDLMIAGSSPATICVCSVADARHLKRINLTMDVRNSIHGLALWPSEYDEF